MAYRLPSSERKRLIKQINDELKRDDISMERRLGLVMQKLNLGCYGPYHG